MMKLSPIEKRWMKSFGVRLAEAMKKQGIGQSDLARISGLSQGTISKYLAGELSPKAYHVKNIADSLGIFIDELL